MRPRVVCYSYCGFLITLATFLSTAMAPAFAQGSPALRSKGVEVDRLIDKAMSPTGVRVIVTLRGATPDPALPPPGSASTQQPSAPVTSGPLGDGQAATVEQAQIITRHLGADDAKRQRWAPRLIRNAPYLAMTVNLVELEALAADNDVVSIHESGELRPGLADSVPLIGMPAAYDFGATGDGRGVAILDTGVEYGHVFVTPRVTQATCFSTPDATYATLCPNGQNFQEDGDAGINCNVTGQNCAHGTHVAGIAAGSRATGSPRNGVARAATIFAVQVFRRRLSDNDLSAGDDDVIAALYDLRDRIQNGVAAHVVAVNLSIWDSGFQVTGPCDTHARALPYKAAIDALRAIGVPTVIISGNGSRTNQTAFPGCISNAFTVSSTTKGDGISEFANMSEVVKLLAPGGDGGMVDSGDITSSVPGGSFVGMWGTSMAAPHVTGAIAAILSECPNLPEPRVMQLEGFLINSGILITDTRPGGQHARRRLRVDETIKNIHATFPHLCRRTVATHDFDGDGKSDIAWRQTSGATTGSTAIWLLNGATVLQSGGFGIVDTGWQIIGQRDFNGDGKHDWLWRHSGGALAIWFLNGLQAPSTAGLATVPPNWGVVATGDFDGDGKGDLLWRENGGAVAIWLLDGAQIRNSGGFGVVPAEWAIPAVADFNADGKRDILWRNSTTGEHAIWFMNGVQAPTGAGLATVGFEWTIQSLHAN